MPKINVIPLNKKLLESSSDKYVEYADLTTWHWNYPVALKLIGNLHFAIDYELIEGTNKKDVRYGLFLDKKLTQPICGMHVIIHEGSSFGVDVKEVPVIEMVITKETERGKGYAKLLYEAVLNRHKIIISDTELYTDEGKINKSLGLWVNHLAKVGTVLNWSVPENKFKLYNLQEAIDPKTASTVRFAVIKEGLMSKIAAGTLTAASLLGAGTGSAIATTPEPTPVVQQLPKDFKNFYKGDNTPTENPPKKEETPQNNDFIVKLRALISKNEGNSKVVYKDTRGIKTIGIGFNLERKDAKKILESIGANYSKIMSGGTLTEEQVNKLFDISLNEATTGVKRLCKKFESYPDAAKMVIIEMAFNLGETGLSRFKNFLKYMDEKNWSAAADELLYKDPTKDNKTLSLWWKQVTNNHGDYAQVKKKYPENRGVTIIDALKSIK